MAAILSCDKFTQFLVNQSPHFDREVIRDIRPEDSLMGIFETGTFPPFTQTSHTYDRFRAVQADLTKRWVRVEGGSCVNTPCDPDRHSIGWGYTRREYFQEQINWKTDLFCFDQMLSVTKAKEHVSQIISDILRPASSAIVSQFTRKRMLDYAGKKWVANAAMNAFTAEWEITGDSEIYLNTTGAENVCKLSPQMLQRRVSRLLHLGYNGRNPFKDAPALIALLTDMETVWDLDKQTTAGATMGTGIQTQWRFQDWGPANQYWKYVFSGQLGNYAIRSDPFIMRFNKVAENRFQVVLPYVNEAATAGIGNDYNEDWDNAQYQMSFIYHPRALTMLSVNPTPINPMMPFAMRSFGGEWIFRMHDLGVDRNGCVIENIDQNKGLFAATFKLAVKPHMTEFLEVIFHKREPACVYCIDTCNDDPGYPTQNYDSANDGCADTEELVFTPDIDDEGNYVLAANTITCNGVPIVHGAIEAASLAALVAALPTILGTWSVVDGSTTQIQLDDSTCSTVVLPWVA